MKSRKKKSLVGYVYKDILRIFRMSRNIGITPDLWLTSCPHSKKLFAKVRITISELEGEDDTLWKFC